MLHDKGHVNDAVRDLFEEVGLSVTADDLTM
jgi:hypothetical protein